MNPLRLELATRRGELRARIAAQRDDLARLSWPVRNTLDLADQGAKGLHWLQDHPGTVSAAVAASVVLRPRRMMLLWSSRELYARHASQAAPQHRRPLLNAQQIGQPGLGFHPIFHRGHREFGPIGLAGGRIEGHDAFGVDAATIPFHPHLAGKFAGELGQLGRSSGV